MDGGSFPLNGDSEQRSGGRRWPVGEETEVIVYNVFAVIRGLEEPDRYAILGNHRDAWTYGAVDPNNGTAALLDIARRYALLLKMGWKPRRTMILYSWDAEEFGMLATAGVGAPLFEIFLTKNENGEYKQQ